MTISTSSTDDGEHAPVGPGTTVSEMADGDAPAVVALWHACGLTRPWNDPATDLANAVATATSTVLVARLPESDSGKASETGAGDVSPGVAGTVMAGYDGHRGWLYYLAVDPGLQGRGIGRSLVVAAEAWLAAQGAGKVQLMVRASNTAVTGFYDALGYTDQECVVLGRRFE